MKLFKDMTWYDICYNMWYDQYDYKIQYNSINYDPIQYAMQYTAVWYITI